jgi:O-antigen/teichoic acid export membrane protein
MASLAGRTAILTLCRLLSSAVVFLSPVFLVRLLDVTAYGQFREFLLYAYLAVNLIGWGIQRNLLYFIPRYPEREKQAVTHTALSLFAVTVAGCALVYIFRGPILARTSFDFTVPLILFIFCYLNLDLFESYWLARKRSDYVLYFTVTYSILRVGAAVLVAWITRSVNAVIWALVAVEASKLLFMGVFAARARLFTLRADRGLLVEQLRFFAPLGLATAILFANRQIGALCVSFLFGIEALAIYMIGGVNLPIVTIVRSATTDVVFPEMAERGRDDIRAGLSIWKRANVLYVFLIFPLFVVLLYYAQVVVETLFTSVYAGSVPIFQVYLLFLLRQSVELGSPLRAANATRFFAVGNVLSGVVNVGFLLLLIEPMGPIGAAVAFVVSDLALAFYMADRTVKVYDIDWRTLFLWKKMAILAIAAAACTPVLFAGELLSLPPLAGAVVFGSIYLGVYVLVVARCHVDEVDIVLGKALGAIRRLRAGVIQS